MSDKIHSIKSQQAFRFHFEWKKEHVRRHQNYFRMVPNVHALLCRITLMFLLCMSYVIRCTTLEDKKGNANVTGKQLFLFYAPCYGTGVGISC